MANRNCPNCGAPYDINLNKCPYCKTSYFDLTAIDIYNRDPFYLKLKAGSMVFTSKVMVKPDALITISQDSVDCVNNMGTILSKTVKSKSVDIDIGFQSVVGWNDKNPVLYTVSYEQ